MDWSRLAISSHQMSKETIHLRIDSRVAPWLRNLDHLGSEAPAACGSRGTNNCGSQK